MYRNAIASLTITFLVSAGFGFILKDILGFWEGFVGVLLLQFFIYNIYISFARKQPVVTEEDKIIDNIVELQTVPVSCPCGNNIFSAPVFFNSDNSFTCEKCNSKFRVEISYESVLLTEPVNIENAFKVLKEKEL